MLDLQSFHEDQEEKYVFKDKVELAALQEDMLDGKKSIVVNLSDEEIEIQDKHIFDKSRGG